MKIKVATPQIDLRELIDQRLSEYDILRYYIGHEFKLGVAFRSCLHPDKGKPSMSVGITKSDHLQWRDWALDEAGGWSDLVGRLYSLSYWQVLEKVAKDFMLMEGVDTHKKITGVYKQPVIEECYKTLIQVKAKRMTAEDYRYWGQYLIDKEDLKREDIHAVSDLYINRKKVELKSTELCFVYVYPEGFAIYWPTRPKGEKWKKNVSTKLIEGLESLNGHDKVLVTKAKKDRIFLQKLVPEVINFQNESASNMTPELVQRLQGKEIITNFDNDHAGKQNSRKITVDMNIGRHLNVPDRLAAEGISDFTDWIAKRGNLQEITDYLREKQVI